MAGWKTGDGWKGTPEADQAQGGGPAATFLSPTDSGFSEVGSVGAVAAGSDNNIDFAIGAGQAAAVEGDGLSGLIGAALFDRGAVADSSPVTLEVILASMPLSSRLCVAMGIGTLPTSLTEIKNGSPYWLEVYKAGNGNISTRCKTGTSGLLAGNVENTPTSRSITFQVAADDIGYGPGHISHRHFKDSSEQRATHDSGTKYTATGNLWLAVLWGKSFAAGVAETISASVEVK